MNKIGTRWALAAAVLTVAAAGVGLMHRHGASANQVRYITATVSRGEVRASVSATGVIQPWKIVDVKSDVAGRIDKLAVDLGDRVHTGQLIALIDPTEMKTADQEAQAALRADRAKDAQAQTGVVQQRIQTTAQVAAAQQALRVSQAKASQAAAAMRAQPSLTNAAISQAQAGVSSAQKAQSEAVQAKQELEAQFATLQKVTIPLNTQTVQSSLAQAKTAAATAKSDYDRQRDLLGQGYVAKADVEQSYQKLSSAQAAADTAAQRQQTMSQENELSDRELKARIAQAQSQIEQSTAQVQQAQAALQAAKDNSVQNEVKREDYQAAQAAVRQAQADVDAAKAGYSAISMKQRDVEAAQAEIGKDQAALREADTNLSYTRVVAPRDGVIIAKNVEEGTVVPSSRASIGSTNALLQIGDTSRMWVVCGVDETDIAQVRLGQAVSVKLDAYPDQPVDGKVIRIDPQVKVDQNVTTIPVTVEIAHPDDRFKNGMNATCDFIIGDAQNVLVVPNEALKGTGQRQNVQVLVNGKPERVAVETGLVGKDTTEIRSGLAAGQAVVTRTVRPQAAKTDSNGTNNPFASPVGGGHGGAGGGRRGK